LATVTTAFSVPLFIYLLIFDRVEGMDEW